MLIFVGCCLLQLTSLLGGYIEQILLDSDDLGAHLASREELKRVE
jgi:hypothetical protein